MEGKTILVVDDDSVSLRIIQKRLSHHDHLNVITAGSGHDALALMKSQKPKLIILDHIMPDMDGLTLCREIKKNPDTQSIPVIFFTCYHAYGFEAHCEKAGAMSVIYKDELTELIDTIHAL